MSTTKHTEHKTHATHAPKGESEARTSLRDLVTSPNFDYLAMTCAGLSSDEAADMKIRMTDLLAATPTAKTETTIDNLWHEAQAENGVATETLGIAWKRILKIGEPVSV